MAAPTATPPASFSLSVSNQINKSRIHLVTQRIRELAHRGHNCSFRVLAAQGPSSEKRPRAPPGVDTRIHWENEDEGWVGGNSSGSTQEQAKKEDEFLGEKFSELLNSSSDSYYQFLGVPANADLEEIKAAYRRLSKEYHPDTTVLPIRTASDMFMKLREIYDVLSNEERRRFYDWTLAQETASREAEKMRMKLEDPYMKEVENWESVPDMVDRLGGRNMELNDQATQALTFDILIIIFSICCIIYVLYFKEPY
ncbi:Chaperone DnaJ-domain superfamily protein [Perilla frutescens var. hirtella]|uniref:Chaperone DnaJ-domain superfamily protein n=1 Tax=Perilla frutescens var. hirtella TaxID=608512 RepID=A0AAD4IUG1_PERFH|nr:Chaperone DnaJ-domain superfamily protein [Perilla frutescens var. frutescens]KAH6821765.1 Chaperone DnaJ-domain superfamily protein [Perilla frutescens var. hirtella]